MSAIWCETIAHRHPVLVETRTANVQIAIFPVRSRDFAFSELSLSECEAAQSKSA